MATQTVQGSPRRYDKKFLFHVEIAGLVVGWFQKCSNIEAEAAVIDQYEAGQALVADQSPGRVKYTPLTLDIGATDNVELYQWWLQVQESAGAVGDPDDLYKKNVAIVVLDRNQQEKRRFNIFKAWISKYSAGDFDATAEENVMEQIVLTYQYFTRVDK